MGDQLPNQWALRSLGGHRCMLLCENSHAVLSMDHSIGTDGTDAQFRQNSDVKCVFASGSVLTVLNWQ